MTYYKRCFMTPALVFVTAFFLLSQAVWASDYYVSANTGKGKKGTKAKPAKDLGNIIKKLKAGDTVHIAGGTYLGKGKAGHDNITVPVKILGGYDDTFTHRDPWGAFKTIFSGVNKSKNFKTNPRLEINLQKFRGKETGEALHIVVDGIIVDNGDRNRYVNGTNKIHRKANPKTGENPTPESAGILIKAAKYGNATVRNCVVINCAPTTGALSVWGSRASQCVIENNLTVNNTGSGLEANSWWHPRDGKEKPKFIIQNNTVLFTWKHDPFGTYGGNGIQVDADTVVSATKNVFGFNDYYGFNNAKKTTQLTLANNLFVSNISADYIEFDTKIDVDDFEDEAEYLSDESEGNIVKDVKLKINPDWARIYGARNLIDRNAAEADVKALNTKANQLRSMLGLPLQAKDLKADSDVWLNRIMTDDAMALGQTVYLGLYGCSKP